MQINKEDVGSTVGLAYKMNMDQPHIIETRVADQSKSFWANVEADAIEMNRVAGNVMRELEKPATKEE